MRYMKKSWDHIHSHQVNLDLREELMKNEVGKKIIDILIEHEGRNKRIAFLPYKVEMWDSFKSVYTEAKRARLNAKICPIQYSTLQYGNKCVSQYDDWRDFRRSPNLIHTLDEFDPEIVITHYPFDYQNSVTTIDNRYYSAELKKQGRTLVYIPYHGATILPAETRLPIMRNVDYIFAANSSNIEMFPKSAKTFVVGSTKKDLIHYTGYSNDVLIINSIAPFIRDKFRIQKYIKIIEENKGSNIIFRPHKY